MKVSRFINFLFAFLFLGVSAFATAFLYRDYQHLDNLRDENVVLASKHAELEFESTLRESQLERLNSDPKYIESVIRTKLNYGKDGETIFRFER